MMGALSKVDTNIKLTDDEHTTFIYRELRNEVDEKGETNCNLPNGARVENDSQQIDPSSRISKRPIVNSVYVCQHDYWEMSSTCSTLVSTALLVILVCVLLFLAREYVQTTLVWLESQEDWIVFALFILLFTLVSFPFTWGYILLNVACGYLQGLLLGVVLVVVAVTCGVIIAHALIKRFLTDFLKNKLLSNSSIRATLAVMGGQQAFRIVAFTRLTPIPFGLQNAIFAISTISTSQYLAATLLGLFPTQVINVYLGSTVRSMEDILTGDTGSATIGYLVFIVQIEKEQLAQLHSLPFDQMPQMGRIPPGHDQQEGKTLSLSLADVVDLWKLKGCSWQEC
uniref:VTT domain-containing protein n=1 Tax=Strigamia maritima TaxID=126957 RepID=T1IHJ8_STRMM